METPGASWLDMRAAIPQRTNWTLHLKETLRYGWLVWAAEETLNSQRQILLNLLWPWIEQDDMLLTAIVFKDACIRLYFWMQKVNFIPLNPYKLLTIINTLRIFRCKGKNRSGSRDLVVYYSYYHYWLPYFKRCDNSGSVAARNCKFCMNAKRNLQLSDSASFLLPVVRMVFASKVRKVYS